MIDFPHTVNIAIRSVVQSRYGGTKQGPLQTIIEDEPAWVQPAGTRDVMMYERREKEVTDTVYFTRDLNLKTHHLIVFGSRVLEVQGFRECTAGLNMAWKALTREDAEQEAVPSDEVAT